MHDPVSVNMASTVARIKSSLSVILNHNLRQYQSCSVDHLISVRLYTCFTVNETFPQCANGLPMILRKLYSVKLTFRSSQITIIIHLICHRQQILTTQTHKRSLAITKRPCYCCIIFTQTVCNKNVFPRIQLLAIYDSWQYSQRSPRTTLLERGLCCQKR